MLDIDVLVGPADSGAAATDVVSVAELGRHIRLSANLIANATWTELLTQAITDAVDKLDGFQGELNRTILKRTYRRFMSTFPGLDECGVPKPILLPFPPVIRVLQVAIEGDSPEEVVSPSSYVVKTGMLVPEIHPIDAWPIVTAAPRAVSVTYEAGYDDEYPPKLRRMVKFLAAHYIENSEASVLEQNKTLIDRKVLFAMDDLRKALRIPLAYDDWNE